MRATRRIGDIRLVNRIHKGRESVPFFLPFHQRVAEQTVRTAINGGKTRTPSFYDDSRATFHLVPPIFLSVLRFR